MPAKKLKRRANRNSKYTAFSRNDARRAFVYLTAYVALILFAAIAFMPKYWYVWAMLVIIPLTFLVKWSVNVSAFRCRNCGNIFEVKTHQYAAGPHGFWKNKKDGWYGWRYLKCPKCGKRTSAIVMMRNK